MKFNSITSLLVKSAAVLAVSASVSFAGVSGKGVVPPPPAPEPASLFDTIGAQLSVGYDTRYYNRGIWMTDNAIWTDLNITVPLTEQLDFYFGSMYLDNFSSSPGNVGPPFAPYEFSQLDLYAGINYDLGFGTFGVNFTQHFYPNTFGGTTAGVVTAGGFNDFSIGSASELGLTFATSFYGFNWDIGYYYNFRIGGSYYETNLSYEIAVTPWMSLVPAFQAGFGNDYFSLAGVVPGARSSGWSHFAFSLSAPIALTPTATLKPYISWISTATTTNYLLGNASANNELIGGVSLSVSF